jgi:CheY-like chemotaxis protein
MSAIFLTTDLIFASRVQAAARSAGVELRLVSTAAAVLERTCSQATDLVILDLTASDCDPQHLVPRLRASEHVPQIIAYAPHVMESHLAAARQAGCERVLTRGQFDRQYDEILRQFARPIESDVP